MSTAEKPTLVSIEDYLAGELRSPVKHEYLGGYVHAMAGANNRHNQIGLNTLLALGNRLRGKRYRPCNSDVKVRIRRPSQVRFYYPDGSVVCRPNPPLDSFQDDPAVVIEVLSKSTRRIDEGEKLDWYLTIPSLSVYLLVDQESASVVTYRRVEQTFVREVYQGLDAVVPLAEIEAELPLAEVYDGVQFTPEPDPQDG